MYKISSFFSVLCLSCILNATESLISVPPDTIYDNNLLVRSPYQQTRVTYLAMRAPNTYLSGNFQNILSLPSLKVSATKMKLGVGAQEVIKVTGTKTQFLTLFNSNEEAVSARLDDKNIIVKGLVQGEATIAVSNGSITDSFVVKVHPYAASIPQGLRTAVFGSPCDSNTIREAVGGIIRRSLETRGRPVIQIAKLQTKPLNIGHSHTYNVPVNVAAENSMQIRRNVHVTVENLGLHLQPEAELWYCNYPENVHGPGFIDSTILKQGVPMRVLYHHINASSYPLCIQLVLRNLSNRTAKVLIIPGDGSPHTDPVRVGLAAAKMFIQSRLAGVGEVIEIPPMTTLPLSIRRLSPRQTMSGLAYLKLLPGGSDHVSIVAEAAAPQTVDHRWLEAASSPVAWRYAPPRPLTQHEQILTPVSKAVFPDPFKTLDADYQVGGNFAFIRIGQKPIESLDRLGVLDGNFGVIYNVDAEVSNPTPKAATVEVVFEASAGYAAGLFIVNGQMQKPKFLGTQKQSVLRTIVLPPGTKQRLTITTIPLSGSNYPATIIIRPAGIS